MLRRPAAGAGEVEESQKGLRARHSLELEAGVEDFLSCRLYDVCIVLGCCPLELSY